MPTLSLAIDARKAKEGAAEFRRATKEAGDAAKDTVRQTKELEKAVDGASGAERRSSVEVARARDERGRFVTAQSRATQEVIRARDELGRFITTEERANRETERLRKQTESGIVPKGLGDLSGAGTLVAELGPVGEQLAQIASRGQAATTALSGLFGLSAGAAAGITAIGAGYVYVSSKIDEAIDKAKQFEILQRQTVALLPRGETPRQSSETVLSVSARSGLKLEDVVAANEALRSQIRDGQEAKLVLTALSDVARASGQNIAQLAGSVGDLVSNYNLSGSQIAGVLERTFVGANESGKKFDEFSRAVAEVGPVAKQVGVDLDQVQVALTKISREVAPGQGADALKKILLAVSDSTDPVNAKLRDLGVNLDKDANGALDLIRVVDEIGTKTRGNAGVINSVFGSRDSAAVFALIRGGADGTRQVIDALANSTNEFSRIYGIQAQTVTAKNEQMSASMEAFGQRYVQAQRDGLGFFDALDKAAEQSRASQRTPEGVAAVIDEVTANALKSPNLSTSLRVLRGQIKGAFETESATQIAKTVEEQTVEGFSNATLKIRSAIDTFRNSIEVGELPPIPIEIAIETQPQEVQAAYKRLVDAASQSQQPLVVGAEDEQAMRVLEQATRAAEAAERARVASLDAERDAQDAATQATRRSTEALEKRARAQAENERDKAAKDLSEYIRSLQEEANSISLDPVDQEIRKATQRVESLTSAYREAMIALGEDPGTVDQLIPDQSQAIQQVTDLVRRIAELKALKEESPVDKYGPFIPDTSQTPAAQDVFGPEFDANAAEGQRRLEELQASLTQERGLLGLSNDERERALFLRDVENEAIRAGVQDRAALVEQMGREFQEFQRLRDLDQLGKDFGRTLASGFEDAIYQAKSFNDAVRDIGRELSQLAFRQFVTKPLTDSLGGLFSGLFTGGAGAGGTGGGIFARGDVFEDGNPMRFALGGAFYRGSVVPFASGGIFDQPTYFPMSGGRTGLLGEAGPEAIMPLTRGPDGKLGVRSDGIAQAAPVQNNTTHVSMTVVTKDADSFRRSAAQITRDLKKRL